MMKINGEKVDLVEIRLMDYLQQEKIDPRIVAVECNEEMVPRAEFDTFVFHENDVVEIVSFMGGG